MLKALVWKESRELAPLVALALVAQVLVYLPLPIFSPNSDRRDAIPFVGSAVQYWWLIVGGATAMALGFWQTVGELIRGTFLFLFHRPLERSVTIATKLGVGITLTLLISGVPILIFALWAATPGTHASPFFWSMTTSTWIVWLQLPLLYVAAFLSGIRPGRWLGSRALPLVAMLPIMTLLQIGSIVSPALVVGLTLLFAACFLCVVFSVAMTRDFA